MVHAVLLAAGYRYATVSDPPRSVEPPSGEVNRSLVDTATGAYGHGCDRSPEALQYTPSRRSLIGWLTASSNRYQGIVIVENRREPTTT